MQTVSYDGFILKKCKSCQEIVGFRGQVSLKNEHLQRKIEKRQIGYLPDIPSGIMTIFLTGAERTFRFEFSYKVKVMGKHNKKSIPFLILTCSKEYRYDEVRNAV